VNNPAVHLAVTISRTLPTYDLQLIAEAVRGGPGALQKLVANTAGIPLRTACTQILAAKLSGDDYHLVAGALLATMEPDPRKAAIDVVWTGPDAGVTTSRLTSAVVVELIEQARTDVLLVGYAVHTEPTVAAALHAARNHGANITLLFERHLDNPAFHGTGDAFPGLDAARLCWPGAARPTGASLHAKILVVDGRSALIGSANLTGAAFERNLECGLLITGGPVPAKIRTHLHRLAELRIVQPVMVQDLN